MKKSKILALSAVFAAGTAFSSASSAFVVDFTNANHWGNPGGSTADYAAPSADYSYPGPFQVTVTAPASNLVFWENQDGFGVQGPGDDNNWDDDIENFNGSPVTEILLVSFSAPADVTRVRAADFLGSGEFSVGGGVWTSFGPGAGTNGPGDWFNIAAGTTNFIAFRAVGNQSSFQVSGLDVSVAPVPVPPAVWLLGSAMVFLFRKRQAS